ncbi:MAG TPA: M20 family peptidase [Longimicrobiales bacterium]|nr:M20 family peptidase [Longimicrobiales bacterium]
MKRFAAVGALIAAVLLLVLTVRAGRRAPPAAASSAAPAIALDSIAVAQRLAAAIQIPTISDDRPIEQRSAPFDRLHSLLAQLYPLVHGRLELEKIGGYSLLYTWRGSDSTARPILLMGHQDVVPVAAGSESSWQQPPFSGAIVAGEVWGRGAIDDKQHVIAILEAAEHLLRQNFTPQRTIYFVFGHDEELSGMSGAGAVAATLRARGVRLEYVLDEGGAIGEAILPGVERATALVKTAEKGYLSLELSVRGRGGHSSTPPRPTPIGVLSRALTALEANPFPARLTGARDLLVATSSEQPFIRRLILRNLWLFGPLVKAQLATTPSTDALLRTTIAPTMLEGSPKDNMLPVTARAVVNFRILPGQSSTDVIAHVGRAIDDQRVQLRTLVVSEPPPPASADTRSFVEIAHIIQRIAPDAIVVPYMLTATTDSRHFSPLTPNIYGFSTARGGAELLQRAHGTNERISVSDLATAVRFYMQLLRAPD